MQKVQSSGGCNFMGNDFYLKILQKYIIEYANTDSKKTIDSQMLQTDLELLEWCCDFVDYLFCKIGLDEKYEPNHIGKELDKFLGKQVRKSESFFLYVAGFSNAV